MVNYFIYARDCSFSTFENEHYHTNGLKTLEQFKRDVENIKEEDLIAGEPSTESKIVYLHWGDGCWDVSEDETRAAYVNLESEQMGTEPEWIIRHLQKYIGENDKVKLLYIITDGLISQESAEKCFRRNEYMHYDTVVFHAFNEDQEKIDLSVAASFFKSRCMVYRNYKLCVSTDISKEFDYDKITFYNFAAKRDQLKSYITLKFMDELRRDADALSEIEKLKRLKDRLSDKSTLDFHAIGLNYKDWNDLVIKVIPMKLDIERSISALINYILSDIKSYSFDALTFDMDDAEEETEDDTSSSISYSSEEEVEIFDFTLEDEVMPVPYVNRRLVDAT